MRKRWKDRLELVCKGFRYIYTQTTLENSSPTTFSPTHHSPLFALPPTTIVLKWKIRALTSSPDSDSARSLLLPSANTKNDVSVVYCDVNDPESIHDAFKGCTHIFANTLFQGAALSSQGGQKAAEKLEYDHGMNPCERGRRHKKK